MSDGGDLFGWDADASSAAAARVAAAGQALQADIAALNAQIQNRPGWIGPEHDTFQRVYDGWQKAATAVEDTLAGVAKLIEGSGDAVEKYREAINKALDA
ncbi:hypothetical protein GCM10009624_29020 [Gordonia sinesedis]